MTNEDASNDIVVVGSINRDYLIETMHRPAPGETVTGARVSTSSGGKGANQAVAAALLGAGVSLIGRVGDDAAGRDVLRSLVDSGVETSGVVVTSRVSTGAAFISVTPDGENSIIVASGANWLLGASDIRAARSQLQAARLLVVQLEVRDDAVEAAVELVGQGAIVVLNAAPYRDLARSLLQRVDVLVLNAVEAGQLLGDEADIDDLSAYTEIGLPATVVTRGSAGARAFIGQHAHYAEAPRREVMDTTGAGDAFVGALCAWLVREGVKHLDDLSAPLARALPAAIAAASYSVGGLGAQASYGTTGDVGAPWLEAGGTQTFVVEEHG